MDGMTPTAISHYDAMVANRQQFLASFLAWASTRPAEEILDQEVSATTIAINQIADLSTASDAGR
jgi:hypothetical protein